LDEGDRYRVHVLVFLLCQHTWFCRFWSAS